MPLAAPTPSGESSAQALLQAVGTQEPMWRSTLAAGKQTAIGLSFFALADLIIPGEPLWSAKFLLGLAGLNFVRELSVRRHGIFGSSFLLVAGASFAAAGILAGVGSALLRESELMMVGVVSSVLGAGMLIAGLHARTRDRERATNLHEDLPVAGAIPMQELRQRLETMRARYQKSVRWATAGIAGFVGAILTGLWALEHFDVSDGAAMVGFAGFWAIIIGAMAWGAKRTRADAETFALKCPACHRPLLEVFGNQRLLKLLEELGRCPQCGARIAHEDPA